MVKHVLGRGGAIVVMLVAIIVMVVLDMFRMLDQVVKQVAHLLAALDGMRKGTLRCSDALQRDKEGKKDQKNFFHVGLMFSRTIEWAENHFRRLVGRAASG